MRKFCFGLCTCLISLKIAIVGFPPESLVQDLTAPRNRTHFSGFSNPQTITRANTNKKVIALTFDDGPDPRFTPRILAILKDKDVRATFFVVGEEAYLHPEIIEQEAAQMHEIENHTYTHPNLLAKTDLTTNEEIIWCHEVIEGLTDRPPVYFRPPRKLFNHNIIALSEIYGYKTILWTVCLENSLARTPQAMVDRVVSKCVPGAIILAHDGHLDRSMTIKALPLLIAELKKQGYEFVTLQELLNKYEVFQNISATDLLKPAVPFLPAR
ncbi:MAG: polysaccharide deacetylase family protein [Acidobacteriota bacterium]